jgi:hypothetical protein
MNSRFQLQIEMRIEPVDEQGRRNSGESMTFGERAELGAMGFMELAKVIGRFHDLTEAIRHGQGDDAEHTAALAYVKELRDHKLYANEAGVLSCREDGCGADGWLGLPGQLVRLRDVVAAIAIHRRECHPAAVTT